MSVDPVVALGGGSGGTLSTSLDLWVFLVPPPPPSWKISGSAPNLCVVVYSLKEYFIQITNQFYCFCPSRKPFLVFMIFLKHFINTATI